MHDALNEVSFFRLSFWIKFETNVPEKSNQFGVKMFGKIYDDWVDTCSQGEWNWVSVVAPKSGLDGGHMLIIFDSCVHPVSALVTRVRLEGFNKEPQALETDKDNFFPIAMASMYTSRISVLEYDKSSEEESKQSETPKTLLN